MKRFLIIVALFCCIALVLTACADKTDDTTLPEQEQPCVHQWEAATCFTAKKCSLCGQTEGEPLAHVVGEVSVKEPTCTEAGVKTGECSLCGTEVTVETIAPLGHMKIHGTCSRCETVQHNLFVAISRDTVVQNKVIDLLSSAVDGISDVHTYYLAALRGSWTNYASYFDAAVLNVMHDLVTMYNTTLTIEGLWYDTKDSEPSTIYAALRDLYNEMCETDEFKYYNENKKLNWEYAAFYRCRGPIVTVMDTYAELMNEKCGELLEFRKNMILSDEYITALSKTPENVICYNGSYNIYFSSESKTRIWFDCFTKNEEKSTYYVELSDGEHTYTQTVADVDAGLTWTTFEDCTFNDGATVTLTFYNKTKKKITSFSLCAHVE